MTPAELGLRFSCEGESLLGVLSLPIGEVADIGVVIVVGGPQYRAGSHRQFVLLARRLAQAGYAALRFDTRGMGDSTGDFPGFEAIGPDIEAAARALQANVPNVQRFVLWGLCDAAAALLIHAPALQTLAGLVLLNPWVRHDDTHARTEVKHYYARRVFEPEFWLKLTTGKVNVATALRELASKLLRMAHSYTSSAVEATDYRQRMAHSALGLVAPQLYVLSGRDHVCAEFLEFIDMNAQLRGLWQRDGVERIDLPEADHTFSSHSSRVRVEDATLAWLDRLAGRRRA